MTEKKSVPAYTDTPHPEKARRAPVLSMRMNEEMEVPRLTHLTGGGRLDVTGTGEALNNAPKRFHSIHGSRFPRRLPTPENSLGSTLGVVISAGSPLRSKDVNVSGTLADVMRKSL